MASNAMHKVGSLKGVKKNTLFGTDGIRGKVSTVLTPDLAMQVGYWSAQVLPKEGPYLIGQDSRTSGSMVTAALTAGLNAAGRDVWVIGLCPTPAISHLIKESKAAGGFMVSASHNPPEDNGIKIFGGDGNKISKAQQQIIESRLLDESTRKIVRPSFMSCGQTYHRNELLKQYQNNLLSSTGNKTLNNIKVVLDLCWGSATSCGAKVFEELGAEVTVINGKPDGNQINVNCGSTHLAPLRKAVLDIGADMGFAFDGDADRMIAVDRKARVLNGDHSLYLWGSALTESDSLPDQRLVGTVMSNLGFERAWQARGGLLERTSVGDQHVHAAMVSHKAGLGGEPSGHILSAAHGLCGDGLLSALQIATLCNEQNLSLSEWLDQSFQAFPQKLVNVPLFNPHQVKRWQDCNPLKDAVNAAEDAMGQEGRVLLRTSGTEPLLRIMVEAQDEVKVDFWASRLAKLAEEHFSVA